MSIRNRLLLWLMAGLVLAIGVAGAINYLNAREEIGELFDYQLRQIALSLRHQATLHPPRTLTTGSETRDDFLAQIWAPEGRLLSSSQPDTPFPFSPGADGVLRTVGWHDASWRVITLTDGDRVIQVVQPLEARSETSAAFTFASLLPIFGLLPVLALLIWISVAVALKPLRQVAAAVGERTPSALAPLPAQDLPPELRPLVEALNELLGRLDAALAAQRRFVADAAHELRTPLTAVQLQCQLLGRAESAGEREMAMTRIRAGLARAGHLVGQLLTLARLEPEGAVRPVAAVDLNAMIRTLLADFSQRAQQEKLDLGLTEDEPATVEGDGEGLRIMLGNLVDNALRYTPAGGRVDIGIRHRDGEALVSVRDTGPGIPPEDRERVFDRFYRRPGSHTSGSGLGLAIVMEVVKTHGGKIELTDGPAGPGLEVTVRLPVAGRDSKIS
ncbi:MAG TPA: ATP-binding protein [Desulfuromonadales bacterium]|nr:ATP-binding protein [Desulfuromonadales bacterium]